jgi:tetratricopeptide (TPR) repeat protein
MDEQAEQILRELERAEALIGLRRFGEAASALHRLLGQDPDNGSGWCLLAQAQLGRDDSEAALEAADRAVAVNPESAWAHRLRSASLTELGQSGAAVAAAYVAIKLAPDEWLGHVCLAQALGGLGSGRDGAVRAAMTAASLAPDESDAHLALGNALAAADKRADAEESFRRALALDPQNSAALNNLARAKMPRSRYRLAGLGDAAAGFQAAVQADPHGSVGSYNLEVTLRAFLARLSYLILILDYVIYWWLHVGSGLIVVLLGAPIVYGLLFVSRIGSGLRRHFLYTVTHGRVGVAAAIQLSAVIALLYVVVGPSTDRGGAAAVALALTLVARLILMKDVAGITGERPFSDRLLRRLVFVFGLIALVFGGAAAGEPSAGKIARDAVVSGACFAGMIWAIRELRRD